MLYRITEMQVWLFSEVCRGQYSGEQVDVAISQGCVPVQSYLGIDQSRLSRGFECNASGRIRRQISAASVSLVWIGPAINFQFPVSIFVRRD